MMNRIARIAAQPATLPMSWNAICASDCPLRRMLAARTRKSCTAPPMQTPITIHNNPGRYPNCAASTGPMSGPAPLIAAKWWPKSTHLLVG